jgi:hypothetical protein
MANRDVDRLRVRHARLIGVALLLILASGCGGGGSPSPAPTGPTNPVPPAPTGDAFRVAVLLSASRPPSPEDVERVFGRANDILFEKTGERMTRTDLVNVGPGSALAQSVAYANAHAAAAPDGILLFSDDSTATSFGGYSQTFSLPSPNENRFPSPVVGATRGYLAVVDFFHKYARCGYDNAGNRIADTSSGGECRNRNGLTCVDNGRYWTCPDTLNDLYADADYFTACSAVHEFLHPFGAEGNFDHYGTAQCVSRTGMSLPDAQNLRLFQQSCGMCPDLYQKFRHR